MVHLTLLLFCVCVCARTKTSKGLIWKTTVCGKSKYWKVQYTAIVRTAAAACLVVMFGQQHCAILGAVKLLTSGYSVIHLAQNIAQ